MKTGEVEFGYESPSVDRVGPFETKEEAARALETLRSNSQAWEDEESND